jgi:hypothetical protein
VSSKIPKTPLIERELIDIERQNIIYSELYFYLLKKKEKTSIYLAVTVANAKLLTLRILLIFLLHQKRKLLI